MARDLNSLRRVLVVVSILAFVLPWGALVGLYYAHATGAIWNVVGCGAATIPFGTSALAWYLGWRQGDEDMSQKFVGILLLANIAVLVMIGTMLSLFHDEFTLVWFPHMREVLGIDQPMPRYLVEAKSRAGSLRCTTLLEQASGERVVVPQHEYDFPYYDVGQVWCGRHVAFDAKDPVDCADLGLPVVRFTGMLPCSP